jgi:tetratricopeptide (TPR) repeat protein
LYNRGICYERSHQYQKAINDLTAIIHTKPDYANAYFNRGCCFEELADIENAIQDYQKALEIENTH